MLSVLLSVTALRDAGWRVGAALVAVFFFTLLLSLAQLDSFPFPALAGLISLVVLAALRPSTTLLGVASVIPVADWLGRRWDPSVAWAEALVVAFSAGYCARGAVATRGRRDELDLPVLLSAAVIVASLVVQFLVDGWRFGGATVRDQLWQLVRQDYLRIAGNGDAVDAAMRLLESLLLFRAASTAARADATFAPLLVRSFVFGAAAAAAVNVLRLWEGALRLSSPVGVFGRYLLTQRFNAHYGDLNAAGSYFVMALFPAIGLASRQVWRWGFAALLIAASLWIAGSRAAFIAGLVAMIVPAAAVARGISATSLRRMTVVTAALVLMLVAVGMVRYLPERGNQRGPATALEVRWQLARTSFRMLAAAPVFGVGIGRYYSRSGEFSSPELLKVFPPAIHENAHNNFLQVLAELGMVGLAAVIWLLFLAFRSSVRLVRADPHDPLRWGVVIGLLASVVSWLGGHPLLVDEPAFLFWVLLGTACGWATNAHTGPPARPRWLVWAVGALILGVGVSVPARANNERADFNLEHRGIGLSHWQDELDGIRYRRAGSISSVFVPSGSSMCLIPLRALKSSGELKVELWLDGRQADQVGVSSDRWLTLKLVLPRDVEAPRFHRLDFRVSGMPSTEEPLLMIGKVQVR
jgi:O-antigen ligase